ncbi:MAG: EF-Tu/IF-2/RF-3 family GTPase [Candidatus Coprovivens sp.]
MGLLDLIFKKREIDVTGNTSSYMKDMQMHDEVGRNYSFCFIIDDIFSVSGLGKVVVGQIVKGSVKSGDQLIIKDTGEVVIVGKIEKFRQILDSASEGENVGIQLLNVSSSMLRKGVMLVKN